MIDVNLTGQIAVNMIQNPITIVSAGAIGGLVTGGLTLLGVFITQKHDAEREEKNRAEEARRTQREERKKAYISFFSYTTSISNMVKYPDISKIKMEDILQPFTQSIAEITLLSPEIAGHISEIYQKYPNFDEKFIDTWGNFANELKADVFPLMQAELNSLPSEGMGVQTKHLWQFWKL